MKKYNYLYIGIIIIFFIIIFISICLVYGYNSGSCKINKNYICNNDFCLYKEFNIYLPENIKSDIYKMLNNKTIQKRVNIETKPENILNCALPNKKGVTISTQNIIKYSSDLINYYENELCNIISTKLNLKLYPTSVYLPTTCALIIYENEGDWINWHYDYNYYDGRFFTVLIPIINNSICTKFQFKNNNNKIISIDLSNNNSICFEGDFLYHRASKLCKNEKRVLLSCQFVTNNNMSFINKCRLKLKDFAYTGNLI